MNQFNSKYISAVQPLQPDFKPDRKVSIWLNCNNTNQGKISIDRVSIKH